MEPFLDDELGCAAVSQSFRIFNFPKFRLLTLSKTFVSIWTFKSCRTLSKLDAVPDDVPYWFFDVFFDNNDLISLSPVNSPANRPFSFGILGSAPARNNTSIIPFLLFILAKCNAVLFDDAGKLTSAPSDINSTRNS